MKYGLFTKQNTIQQQQGTHSSVDSTWMNVTYITLSQRSQKQCKIYGSLYIKCQNRQNQQMLFEEKSMVT